MVKKKKYSWDEYVESFLILIFGISIIILFIYGVFESFDKPDFKITKEECRNETQIINSLVIYKPNILNVKLDCYATLHKHKENKTYSVCDLYKEKEICKQVEVDDDYLEIEVCEKSEFKNISKKTILIKNCFDKDFKSALHKEDGIYCCNSVYKEDLSIEFLDENCECVYYGFLHKGFYCYDAGDFDGEKNVEIGKEYCETEQEKLDRGCNYYKCGEYNVEVIQ